MHDEIEKLIREVLEKGHLMSLATVDISGPWVSDLIYVYDDSLNLYWLSHTDTRHSRALDEDERAAASITISNAPGQDNVGLQIEGKAERVGGDILKLAQAHLRKRNRPADDVKEGEIIKPGHSWYKLTPAKIELIYEPKFGFEKRSIELKHKQ